MRKIAVIGLGRFGFALAKNLAATGVQVIGVDRDGRIINEIKDEIDLAVRIDSTDQAALLSQDIDKVDVCVVSIGEHFESALLTTVIAKQIGIPEVICRAQTSFHAEIFQKIGADRVIQPEEQAGEQLARQLSNPQLMDVIQLADGITLLEIRIPKAFQGKSLAELDLRNRFDVNLVVIRRNVAEPVSDLPETAPVPNVPLTPNYKTVFPRPKELLQEDDILVVVGSNDALARLPRE